MKIYFCIATNCKVNLKTSMSLPTSPLRTGSSITLAFRASYKNLKPCNLVIQFILASERAHQNESKKLKARYMSTLGNCMFHLLILFLLFPL